MAGGSALRLEGRSNSRVTVYEASSKGEGFIALSCSGAMTSTFVLHDYHAAAIHV